ncbi:MAG TPA: hypothetical protein VJ011_06345, partial [Steroidobacteraceae bacterium]|nr:hypothetical protein [Steroidobacteraceae bacterium]
MSLLTGQASLRSCIGFETLAIDRLLASYAHAVCTGVNAIQGRLDVANFLHVARDLREIDVDEQVCERVLLGIVNLTGDACVLLGIHTQKRIANLPPQRPPARAQLALEERKFWSQDGCIHGVGSAAEVDCVTSILTSNS